MTTIVDWRISSRGGHATFFISPRTSERYWRGPVRSVCVALPFGWLALGNEYLIAGRGLSGILVPLLCFGGLAGISALSLRRSYRTTLRMYRGEKLRYESNMYAILSPEKG